jgi:hypothetical protein
VIRLTASLSIHNLPARLRYAIGAAVELISQPTTCRPALRQPRPDAILLYYGGSSRRSRLATVSGVAEFGRGQMGPSKARAPVTFVCPHTGPRAVMGSIVARKNVGRNHAGYSETDQFSDQFSNGRYVIVTEGWS